MNKTINDALIGGLAASKYTFISFYDALISSVYMKEILLMLEIITTSVKRFDGFNVDDIRKKTESAINGGTLELDNKNYGNVLCWIFLASFSDLFVDHDGFDKTVRDICNITHDDNDVVNVSLEYCHLLHDIYCNYQDRDGILKIFPEFDIIANDVPVLKDARCVFFASLWAFVNSTNYISALDNVRNLEWIGRPITWITFVTGTIAGLYYGVDTIPEEILEDPEFKEIIETLKI